MVVLRLLNETWLEFREDRAGHHGAALAFFALFAVAPLALVLIAVTAFLFGQDAVQDRLAPELEPLLTPEIARAIQYLVRSAVQSRSGWAASGVGIVASLYGGLRGFLELQATLNAVWGVRAIRGPGLLELVRRKLLAFGTVLLCGSLLVASMMATLWLHPYAQHAADRIHWPLLIARRGEDLSSFVIASVLLTIVYKTLPDVRIAWRDVILGALVSAALFVVGKHAMAFYLRSASTASTFGAAGTLVVVLMYIQYMAQVLLFGAKFTWVYARYRGHPVRPGPGAARVVRTVMP